MSGIRGVMKEGWHPKSKDGGEESWRSDFKGINQVAGFIGKGKSSPSSAPRTERASRPLSSLKDPSSFAPPPRRSTAPNTGGFGSMPAETGSQGQRQPEQVQEEDTPAKPSPPPVPYRADTTGLSTSQFAKPPARRNEMSTDRPDPGNNAQPPHLKPKPAFPPRLPPRGTPSKPPALSPSPPAAYEDRSESHLNQSAVNRLGNAGVSVGSLGIQPSARNGSNNGNIAQSTTHTSSAQQSNPQNELQARFAKMSTSSSENPPVSTSTAKAAAAPQAQGRDGHSQTHAEPHQQAPQHSTSDISYGNAKRATSSANNFRERHNDHIQAGKNKFNSIDQKYGIKRRISGFIEDQKSPAYPDPNSQHQPQPCPHQCHHQCQQQSQEQSQQQPYYSQSANSPYSAPSQNTSRPDMEALNKRKPPPPPPPSRKPGREEGPGQTPSYPGSAPPLPLDTKPR